MRERAVDIEYAPVTLTTTFDQEYVGDAMCQVLFGRPPRDPFDDARIILWAFRWREGYRPPSPFEEEVRIDFADGRSIIGRLVAGRRGKVVSPASDLVYESFADLAPQEFVGFDAG